MPLILLMTPFIVCSFDFGVKLKQKKSTEHGEMQSFLLGNTLV